MKNGDAAVISHTERDPRNEPVEYHKGLAKREYFAAMAMQGLVTLKGSDCMDSEITARQCVRYADALLKALGEDNENE